LQTLTKTTFQLGDPIEHRGIAVTPLFPRRTPACTYLTLDEALVQGFRVSEIDDAGAVPQLFVVNPLDTSVLLYDGEELVGAKQNRVFNLTVLVDAKTEIPIPVSCVEEGRWHRRSRDFDSAQRVSDPELRRRKNERLAAEPLALGAAQNEVWQHVREKAARLGAYSPTAAHADTYAARERDLAELRSRFPIASGQSGAVLALPDGTLCLDYVSRPDAFSKLYPKLLEGYLLDAIEHLDGEAVSAAEAFVAGVGDARWQRGQSAGLGEDIRLRGSSVAGSGLELAGELIQLSAFTSDGDRPARIARPGRRR
jgi:hypothetical protein